MMPPDIEARTFDDVGNEEIELGISLAKEISKAVYQLSDLLDQLKALKKAQL